VEQAALARNLDLEALDRHCGTVEDQVALRRGLDAHDLVAFVADGSSLPRRSGVDDRPFAGAVPFRSPESLSVTMRTPNSGAITGMGLKRGISLIVGGGFHGKSTLLRAVEGGVWDHIPGDGRERVVTDPTAVKIRAEDGRAVHGVDISPFIDNLPHGNPTSTFTTELASGSTSQAAALVEGLECSAAVVLLDEDTSATNFMIRDRRMQELVSKDREPITPFVDRIRELRDELGVSTVLVMGGSGDYFDHADTVIQMDAYVPRDVTGKAKRIAESCPTGRTEELGHPLHPSVARRLDPSSIDPHRKPGRTKIQARGRDTLVFGRRDVDLRAVEFEDASQIRVTGWILAGIAAKGGAATAPIPAVEEVLERLSQGHWDILNGRPDGDLVRPRLHEVMATLNRLRGAILHE
jgi:predicted ABC-class ATPase